MNYDFGLDICERYYEGIEDFLENSYAVSADNADDMPIGICYSAGNDGGRCEIDVFVTDDYRERGVGADLVRLFIKNVRLNGIEPTWDCYSDNIPSRKLAECVGGNIDTEYAFYNIAPSVI